MESQADRARTGGYKTRHQRRETFNVGRVRSFSSSSSRSTSRNGTDILSRQARARVGSLAGFLKARNKVNRERVGTTGRTGGLWQLSRVTHGAAGGCVHTQHKDRSVKGGGGVGLTASRVSGNLTSSSVHNAPSLLFRLFDGYPRRRARRSFPRADLLKSVLVTSRFPSRRTHVYGCQNSSVLLMYVESRLGSPLQAKKASVHLLVYACLRRCLGCSESPPMSVAVLAPFLRFSERDGTAESYR